MTTDNLTPEEIREGNALIAEHMGARLIDGLWNFPCNLISKYAVCGDEHLDYDCDWQWMIPAWAKVYAELEKWENRRGGYAHIKVSRFSIDFSRAANLDDKPSAFRTLVAAIKLLNEKTK